MRIGLAQVESWVGDLGGNVERCLAAIETATLAGAELVVLPELILPGYPPRDILNDDSFVAATEDATADLAERARGLAPSLVGTLRRGPYRGGRHPGLHNIAALLADGEVTIAATKRLLPSYDVFHEARWFLPGQATAPPLELPGRPGVLICEDLWDEGYPIHPATELRAAGAGSLLSLSASPYRAGVLGERLATARRVGLPVVHVNLVGATDELIFDGRSFVLDAGGEVVALLSGFAEEIRVVDLADLPPPVEVTEDRLEELHRGLVEGIRQFTRRNGLRHAVVGVSGGIDSALVLRLAVEALGPASLTAVAIPSRHTDPRSTEAAQELCRSLGVTLEVVPLEPLHVAAERTVALLLPGDEAEAAPVAENLQARLRAVLLMAVVNRRGGLLLNTSNKTELALGYSTLYGDQAGGLAPIGDLTKPEVYALARHLGGFPAFILERPPSAELAPGQVDPFDYPRVAPAMEALVEASRSDQQMRRSEHKRWQMGVVLKVSRTAFGSGRMMPITRR